MIEPRVLSAFDARLLAEAFPASLRRPATEAAEEVLRHLHRTQWTDRFVVHVAAQAVAIPSRLHFASSPPAIMRTDPVHLIARCLESRSNDGFQRQHAARDLLLNVQPWSAPFIVTLIGEYVVEILQDKDDALTPQIICALAEFASGNPAYWDITRQRVASYWSVYYRALFTRRGYVGFHLVDVVEQAMRSRAPRPGRN